MTYWFIRFKLINDSELSIFTTTINLIMVQQNSIKVFEAKKVRTLWDSETEEWYFSVVDVVAVLTENDYQTARNYWKVLKNRLKKKVVSWLQNVTN